MEHPGWNLSDGEPATAGTSGVEAIRRFLAQAQPFLPSSARTWTYPPVRDASRMVTLCVGVRSSSGGLVVEGSPRRLVFLRTSAWSARVAIGRQSDMRVTAQIVIHRLLILLELDRRAVLEDHL